MLSLIKSRKAQAVVAAVGIVAALLLVFVWIQRGSSSTPTTTVPGPEMRQTAAPPLQETDDLAPSRLHVNDNWAARANRAKTWPIPLAMRLPGGPTEVTLSSSPEAWLLSLPISQQPAAQAFLERNTLAYAFQSKAEQAWLIESGFPSLEEAAYFAGLPRKATCVSTVQELQQQMRSGNSARPCVNPKMAALSSDFLLREIQMGRDRLGTQAREIEVAGVRSPHPVLVENFFLGDDLKGLLRGSTGPYRFYQYASLERLSPAEDRSELDPADGETISLALAFACEGDQRLHRLRAPELWSRPATLSVLATMNFLGYTGGLGVCEPSRQLQFPETR